MICRTLLVGQHVNETPIMPSTPPIRFFSYQRPRLSAEAVVLRLSPALHVYHVSNGQARRPMGICRRRPLTRLSGACRHEQARICLLVAGIKIPAAASSSPPPSRRNYLISVKCVYFQELFLIAAAELLGVLLFISSVSCQAAAATSCLMSVRACILRCLSRMAIC